MFLNYVTVNIRSSRMVILVTSNILSWLLNHLLNSNLQEEPLRYKLVGTTLTITGQKRTFGSNFVKHYTMSSPMHTHIVTANFNSTSVSKSTNSYCACNPDDNHGDHQYVIIDRDFVVFSSAPAPVISSVSTSSTVLVSAMSTVITSPSTVTSPFASVTSAILRHPPLPPQLLRPSTWQPIQVYLDPAVSSVIIHRIHAAG